MALEGQSGHSLPRVGGCIYMIHPPDRMSPMAVNFHGFREKIPENGSLAGCPFVCDRSPIDLIEIIERGID